MDIQKYQEASKAIQNLTQKSNKELEFEQRKDTMTSCALDGIYDIAKEEIDKEEFDSGEDGMNWSGYNGARKLKLEACKIIVDTFVPKQKPVDREGDSTDKVIISWAFREEMQQRRNQE